MSCPCTVNILENLNGEMLEIVFVSNALQCKLQSGLCDRGEDVKIAGMHQTYCL